VKPGTDVVLVGHAYAGARPEARVDVSLDVGPLRKIVRVTGDRVWTRAGMAWIASRPVPFQRLPLVYERALAASTLPIRIQRDGAPTRESGGTGYLLAGDKDRLEGCGCRTWKARAADR